MRSPCSCGGSLAAEAAERRSSSRYRSRWRTTPSSDACCWRSTDSISTRPCCRRRSTAGCWTGTPTSRSRSLPSRPIHAVSPSWIIVWIECGPIWNAPRTNASCCNTRQRRSPMQSCATARSRSCPIASVCSAARSRSSGSWPPHGRRRRRHREARAPVCAPGCRRSASWRPSTAASPRSRGRWRPRFTRSRTSPMHSAGPRAKRWTPVSCLRWRTAWRRSAP